MSATERPTRFAVLGDGAMGTACASLLARQPNHAVTLWCASADHAGKLQAERENHRYLPGCRLADGLAITADFAAVVDADVFVLAVPMLYLERTAQRWRPDWPESRKPLVVSVVKGIEQQTLRTASQLLRDVLGQERFIALSGPSHAEEMFTDKPTSVVAAGATADADRVQRWFNTKRFRVYTARDLLGTELAGALKNVIAIGAGISDGLGLGDNSKSALISRGIAEMMRFGKAMGVQPATFIGLAGVGDLVTTCFSPHGRNRRVGERLGRGETLAQILASTASVAEGIWTARAVHVLAQTKGIPMPLCEQVYCIAHEGKTPRQALEDLMSRDPTAEFFDSME